jgi:rubrerythrin
MNIQQALQTALAFEKKGKKIYTEAAEKTKNPFVKEVFSYLARQEENHVQELAAFIEKHHPDIKLEGDTQEETKHFFTMTADKFNEKLKVSKKDLQAYEAGLELERSAYAFYKKELEEAPDEKTRHFFTFLIEQESAHYSLIRNAYDYLKDPANFHMEEERWMFEG